VEVSGRCDVAKDGEPWNTFFTDSDESALEIALYCMDEFIWPQHDTTRFALSLQPHLNGGHPKGRLP